MSLTRAQAVDSILAILKAAWDPTGYPMKWENVGAVSTPPTSLTPWARAVLRHATSRQATLSGVSGQRRFRRTGSLVVQIFQPSGEGLVGNPDLARIVQDAFEGAVTPGGVIVRSVVVNEVGPDGAWFQTNVVVSFEYDEIK